VGCVGKKSAIGGSSYPFTILILEKLMYKRLYNYVETKKYYQNINNDFAEIDLPNMPF
jgi:hypothetical protein